MKLNLFDYTLPRELIAQTPAHPRDHSRLLVLDKKNGKISHHKFYEIEKFLKTGDLLVLNDTKVFPARLYGKKKTGGKIEVFLLHEKQKGIWQVLLGGKRRAVGLELQFGKKLKGKIIKKNLDRTWLIKFDLSGRAFDKIINKIGQTPTPPYIKTKSTLKNYQTIYAKHIGSAAAPTAGFHFTKRLIKKLKKKGVRFEYVTLHVGLGTFEPVRVDDIRQHKMHGEYAVINKATKQRINKAIQGGSRIIAVGTTCVRVLESLCNKKTRKQKSKKANSKKYKLQAGKKYINTFIYPGYKFHIVSAMITNFHLPKSTLLMLVSAFVSPPPRAGEASLLRYKGVNLIKKTYKSAIRKKYRFYSFGDVMLIK